MPARLSVEDRDDEPMRRLRAIVDLLAAPAPPVAPWVKKVCVELPALILDLLAVRTGLVARTGLAAEAGRNLPAE